MTEIGMALSNRIDGTRFPGCVGWPLPDVEVKQDQDGGILVKGQGLIDTGSLWPQVGQSSRSTTSARSPDESEVDLYIVKA